MKTSKMGEDEVLVTHVLLRIQYFFLIYSNLNPLRMTFLQYNNI